MDFSWTVLLAGVSGSSSTPNYCLIKGYSGPGVGNIDADPKFLNPAAGDIQLKADSPCIDAGKVQSDVKADIKGVQRGLQGVQELRGDGSAVDIGAFEFIPEPVGVWLTGGGPDLIRSGDNLTVSWKQTEAAGTAILLRLMAQGVPVVDYGAFYSPTSQAEQNLQLPSSLPTHNSYWIEARSSFNPSLTSNTPFFRIQNPQNLIPAATWTIYP